MKAATISIALIALMSGAISFAAEESPAQSKQEWKQLAANVKSKCKADAKKFCKNVKPGEGRIAACLDSREDKVSDGCKEARKDAQAKLSEKMDQTEVAFRKNCGDDVKKFCSDVPSGEGRILDCLNLNKGNVSAACKNYQVSMTERLREILG